MSFIEDLEEQLAKLPENYLELRNQELREEIEMLKRENERLDAIAIKYKDEAHDYFHTIELQQEVIKMLKEESVVDPDGMLSII